MSLEGDIEILGLVPQLSDFSEDRLRLLAFSSENRTFADGQRLFSAGDRADSAYVVSLGEVALYAPGNAETPVAVLGPGRMIGEMALIVETTRASTALARGAVTVIQIRRPLFRRMLDEFPDIARRLQARVAADLGARMDELMAVRDRLDRLD